VRTWIRTARNRYVVLAAGVPLVVAAVLAAVVAVRHAQPTPPNRPVAGVLATAQASPLGTPSPSPAPSASATATAQASAAPAAANPSAAGAPAHFATQPAGAALPSSAQCSAWVRATQYAESKGANRAFNQATGQHVAKNFLPASDDARANQLLSVRIDGQFTGTTRQILRWAACKWGVDEDVVLAQAAVESWWLQNTMGDWGTDPAACPPGHPLGADGKPGQCPQSYGILQNRWSLEQSGWPALGGSTAMNADMAYGIWRACFEGYELWLNDVEHAGRYGAGDAWGCVGRWFSGRWHTAPAEGYITKVKGYLNQRIWEQPSFQQP
jgi:autotransporter family porin